MNNMVGLGKLADLIRPLVIPHITAVTGNHPADGLEYSIGTATLVAHRQRRFIVTAAHVAAKLADGYELGVFKGQGENPARLWDHWWTSLSDAARQHEPWDEDIAILDVTDLLKTVKQPLPSSFFASDLVLSEKQGIFLCGFAANPVRPEDGKIVELLQHQDLGAKALHVAPLSSAAHYLPDIDGLRAYEFAIHFSATENRLTNGKKLELILDAHGFSGSMLWRVKGSPPSPSTISVDDLEAIGVVTKWRKAESVIEVTDINEVRKILDRYVDSFEAQESATTKSGDD